MKLWLAKGLTDLAISLALLAALGACLLWLNGRRG